MSDPKRWLDDEADAAPRTRELLRSGLAMDPPPGAQDEVWAALSGKIGALGSGGEGGPPHGTGPSAPTNPAAGAAGGSAAAGKVAGIAAAAVGKGALLAIAGGTLLGGLLYGALSGPPSPSRSPDQPKEPTSAFVSTEFPSSPPAMATADVPLVEPRAALPEEVLVSSAPRPKPSAAPKEHPAAASSADSAAAQRASRLREENRSLGEAREALRGGDASAALEKLDAMAGRFPEGTLAQEREALAIEALYRAGHRDAAKTRAEAFLRAYPTSLHATKVRGFLQ